MSNKSPTNTARNLITQLQKLKEGFTEFECQVQLEIAINHVRLAIYRHDFNTRAQELAKKVRLLSAMDPKPK